MKDIIERCHETPCTDMYNLYTNNNNLIRNCAYTKEKESFDEAAEALIDMSHNKILGITHGICPAHSTLIKEELQATRATRITK